MKLFLSSCVLTLNQPENAWYVPAFAMVSDKDSTKYLCLQNKVQHLLGAIYDRYYTKNWF